MVRAQIFLLVFALAIFSTSCGKRADAARLELAQMEIPFTEMAFIDSARQGNASAVGLFLDAGISVEAKTYDGIKTLHQINGLVRSPLVTLSKDYLKTKGEKTMHLKKMVMCGTLVMAFIAASGLAASKAHDNDPPSSGEIAFAQRTSDLMVNELVAALFKEFDETTPQNIEEGKRAISLIFNNSNRDMRLIGTFGPLLGGGNDLPNDNFEQEALDRALQGQTHTSVERVNDRWYYRRSVALSNTLHQNCALCHTNFTERFFRRTHNPGQWVGALTLRVPIE